MTDPTEGVRRIMTKSINEEVAAAVDPRKELEEKYGQVWDSAELRQAFDVTGFMAPFVVVRRKSDGQTGSLMFGHSPRFYFSFTPDA